MIQDGGQVIVAEPARDRGQPERLIHGRSAGDGGELDRAGHLGPDPLRPGGGGFGQPPGRARAQAQERFLGCRPRPRPGLARAVPGRVAGVMLIDDPRAARSG